MEQTVKEIAEALIKGQAPLVKELVETCLNNGVIPQEILSEGLIAGMSVIGRRFKADEIFHAYPDVAHTAISPRVHVQDGPMYPCIGARKSVVLSGRRFSAHYRRPLMARISD